MQPTTPGHPVSAAMAAELARFLDRGPMHEVATRDERLMPEVVVGQGAWISTSGETLSVLIPEPLAARTLANARAHREVAAVFVNPINEQSVQIKGTYLSHGPADAGALAARDRWRVGATEQLELVGLPRSHGNRMGHGPALVLHIRIRDVYEATPGPRAGKPLAG